MNERLHQSRSAIRHWSAPLSHTHITIIYIVIGFAWIFLSDRILESVAPSLEDFSYFQTLKGIAFVSATAAILFFLLKRNFLYFTNLNAEHEQIVARLRDSEAILDRAQDAARMGIWEYRIPENQLEWSQTTYEIFGIERSASVNEYDDFFRRVHPDDREGMQAAQDASINDGVPLNLQHRILLPDGEIRYVHECAGITRDTNGKPWRLTGIVLDITDRMAAEIRIKELNAELEARVRQRTADLERKTRELEKFTYSVSHDLKAPLRGIDGYSRLLMEDHADDLDEEGKLFVTNIRSGTDRMEQLIDDLLAYSRIERTEWRMVAVDIVTALNEILAERAHDIETNNVEIDTNLPDGVILTDPHGIYTVLRNLLDNSLKYTRKSEAPRISIAISGSQADWSLVVKDNGIGFEQKYAESIFEIFNRLHRDEEFPGTGIGLAIVRKAVEGMGGKVRAEGEVGKGATITVEMGELE